MWIKVFDFTVTFGGNFPHPALKSSFEEFLLCFRGLAEKFELKKFHFVHQQSQKKKPLKKSSLQNQIIFTLTFKKIDHVFLFSLSEARAIKFHITSPKKCTS